MCVGEDALAWAAEREQRAESGICHMLRQPFGSWVHPQQSDIVVVVVLLLLGEWAAVARSPARLNNPAKVSTAYACDCGPA